MHYKNNISNFSILSVRLSILYLGYNLYVFIDEELEYLNNELII